MIDPIKKPMIRNYLTIAFRSLMRDKLNSFVNLSGLAVGLACSILIYLYVKDELTFDSFHTKHERIYRMHVAETWDSGDVFENTVSPLTVAPAMKDYFSQVEASTVYGTNSALLRYGEESARESYAYGGEDFFKIFDFEVIKGSLIEIFNNPSDAVLTKTQATKLFGDNDPVGESFELLLGDGYREFIVKAVIDDMPSNSSLQFATLISTGSLKYTVRPKQMKSWFSVFSETYVLLRQEGDLARVEARIPEMVDQYVPKNEGLEEYMLGFQPLTDIHLNTDFNEGVVRISDPKYIYILTFIALFILAIACINFTTLNIAKSVDRAKEIGIRKVSGAYRYSLISQFLIESLVMTSLAMAFGLMLSLFLLQPFNELSSKTLIFDIGLVDGLILTGFGGLLALLAGAYPALVLSAFDPIRAFKGKVALGQGKQFLRKALVCVQFTISLFMISCTLLVLGQLNYLQDKDLGFKGEAIIAIPMNIPFTGSIVSFLEEGMQDGARFAREATNFPEVEVTSVSSNSFAAGAWISLGFNTKEKVKKKFKYNAVDPNYLKTMNIELIQGRDFDPDNVGDKKGGLIVNEAFIKEFQNEVGESFFPEIFGNNRIIGVVADFNYESLHHEIEPLMLSQNPAPVIKGAGDLWLDSDITPKVFIALKDGQVKAGIAQLEEVWRGFYPSAPFDFDFVEERLAEQYESEANLGEVVRAATIVAILISCLGLLSLATLTINGRIKEIGIRKVLGAPVQVLLLMLSKEYFYIILLSALVSVPLVVLFMDGWLDNFAYRINIGAVPFVLGFVSMSIIAGVTIGYKVLSTSMLNPAITLKDE